MNTSLCDDEFDGLLADERLQSKKTYVERLTSIPRWEGKLLRLQEMFCFKLGFQSACLVANVIGLIIIAFTISSLLPILRHNMGTQCGLPTDSLLGENIGWRTITWESDPAFIEADPENLGSGVSPSIWSVLYPSSWVWVSDPSKLGFGGGIKLVDYAEDPSEFENAEEGFVIAVMHQLHCVAELKSSLVQYRRDGVVLIPDENLDHCIEYLRQAVMCHGDLTFERPQNMSFPHGTTGWGDMHRCRDWGRIVEAIKERSISRVDAGWRKQKSTEVN